MKYFIVKGKGGVVFFSINKLFSEKDICKAFISNCPDSRKFCYYYNAYVPYFLHSERVTKHLVLFKFIIFTFKITCLMKTF